jgi:hypothetical protein
MAENYTLKIDAGADYFLAFRLKDEDGNYLNLSSCSAAMQLKNKHNSEAPLVSLTSEALGGITFEKWDDITSEWIDTIAIHITDVQTALLVDYEALDSDGDVAYGEGVYDLEITDEESMVTRTIQGYWIASPEVTR